MKNPIALAIAAAAAAAGFIAGHLLGRAKSEMHTQQLQQEILGLQQQILKRDATEAQLRAQIQRCWQEIETIHGQHIVIAEFTSWMAEQHPEILRRYREIRTAEANMVALSLARDSDRRALAEKQVMLSVTLAKEHPAAPTS